MATCSSILAWKIPWTKEPGGYSPRSYKELDTTDHAYVVKCRWLQSTELQRVGHDWPCICCQIHFTSLPSAFIYNQTKHPYGTRWTLILFYSIFSSFNGDWFFNHSESGPEKAMAPHSSILAWKIPWTEEPGRLQSLGSIRVGHDWATSLSLFTFMHWRRKWQPTPVFLPGEWQGQGSLVGCHLWGCTESDTTEVT